MNTEIIQMICEYIKIATEYAAFIGLLLTCVKMIVKAFSGKVDFI